MHPHPHPTPHRRCAIVGLGSRAQLYTTALALSGPYSPHIHLAAFCDTNTNRDLQWFRKWKW